LGAAKTIGAALYWANLGDDRVVFLHSHGPRSRSRISVS
jgi:hypothetical protein